MWPWWRHWRGQRDAARHAHAEAEQARVRLETARREVIEPLRRAAERNQFAEIIRQSLLTGHTQRPAGGGRGS